MPPVTEKTRDAPSDKADASDAPIPMMPVSDVQKLVIEQVALATAQISKDFAEQFKALQANFQPQALNGFTDKAAMEALAVAIASVNDQEFGKRRVPPEELAKRLRAREAMEVLLKQTQESGVQPTYFLRQKMYLGERMIEPFWLDRALKITKPTEIGWYGIPNEFMDPSNDEARAIHALFLESIGGRKRVAKLGVTANGLTVRSGGMNPNGGHDKMAAVGRDLHEPVIKGRGGDMTEVITTHILGTLMPPARQMV